MDQPWLISHSRSALSLSRVANAVMAVRSAVVAATALERYAACLHAAEQYRLGRPTFAAGMSVPQL